MADWRDNAFIAQIISIQDYKETVPLACIIQFIFYDKHNNF
jgi:hypothetical protein